MLHIRSSAFGLILASCLLLQAQPTPPVAKRVPHQEVRHGATVIDNYFWLREKSNPEVVQYLEAENAYTEAMTQRSEAFQRRPLQGDARAHQADRPRRPGPPRRVSSTTRAPKRASSTRSSAAARAAWKRPKKSCSTSTNSARTRSSSASAHFVVSDDQNLLAYTIDYTGFRQYSLQVKDLRTGRPCPDTTERVTSVAWAADNKTLFLTTEDEVTKRSDKLWRHTSGLGQLRSASTKRRTSSTISAWARRATRNT